MLLNASDQAATPANVDAARSRLGAGTRMRPGHALTWRQWAQGRAKVWPQAFVQHFAMMQSPAASDGIRIGWEHGFNTRSDAAMRRVAARGAAVVLAGRCGAGQSFGNDRSDRADGRRHGGLPARTRR